MAGSVGGGGIFPRRGVGCKDWLTTARLPPPAGPAMLGAWGHGGTAMREVRTDPEILSHAIADAINDFVRVVLVPRCPPLDRVWSGQDADELDRLKYSVAAEFAAKWPVSLVNDDAPPAG
jgi:hypothetical protein